MTVGATFAQQVPPSVRPLIGVSSCLLGEQVRFNGGHSRCRFLTGELGPHVDWVPHCPEMAIGLGTPRETLRLTVAARLVNRTGTAGHTAAVAALPLPRAWTATCSRPSRRPAAFTASPGTVTAGSPPTTAGVAPSPSG